MKAFAKAFYESAAWRRTRAYILKRDAGLCVRCGAPGCIVHHKTELTPRNIDDPIPAYKDTEISARSFFEVEHSKELAALEQAARRKRLIALTY